MHLHFERIEKPHSYSDCNILSLSWMGKVPDGLLQSSDEDGWKLNRTNYYQDGWIALGNSRGIVGVTYTTCRCRKTSNSELPPRTNYNLRGHRSEVTLVKWNEPYQKLASCDSSGIIFVWIKYEGRWSVELINDRNTQVIDFSWSHDGRMALICYIDGFVLIGSVAGQRYWSSMLNLDSCSTTCGIWTPDDQQVIFGTSNGSILVIDINGTIVAQLSIRENHSIISMSWSSEKFKMEDIEEVDNINNNRFNSNGNLIVPVVPSFIPSSSTSGSTCNSSTNRSYVLAICFDDGVLYLLKSYDDICPTIIRTNLNAVKMEWSNKGDILAVGGHRVEPIFNVDFNNNQSRNKGQNTNNGYNGQRYINMVKLYNETGNLRYQVMLDYNSHSISSLTWGHNDKRIFVGTGPVLHIAWVTKKIASLHLLCRLAIYKKLNNERSVESLPLPSTLQNLVASLFGRTLRCYLPDNHNLTKFTVNPPASNTRLYCTLIRHEEDIIGSSSSYILYLEYLGGLVPILKGKRTSKIRPEFVIFHPQLKQCEDGGKKIGGKVAIGNGSGSGSCGYHSDSGGCSKGRNKRGQPNALYWHSSSTPGTSDSENEEHITVRVRRRRRQHRGRRHHGEENDLNGLARPAPDYVKPESTYADSMPEDEKLTLITSNIWGTKFKIIGLVPWLPSALGSVAYRTSLLHLQPRQMTLKIKELGGQREGVTGGFIVEGTDKMVTSSEDEDESFGGGGGNGGHYDDDYAIPIAPMTPKKTSLSSRSNYGHQQSFNPMSNYNPMRSDSLSNDYVNLLSNLSEDLLTLHVNGGSNGQQLVSMEMASASSGSFLYSPTYNTNLIRSTTNIQPTPTSNSISTQTSFQSLTDILNPLIQMSTSTDKPTVPVSNGLQVNSKEFEKEISLLDKLPNGCHLGPGQQKCSNSSYTLNRSETFLQMVCKARSTINSTTELKSPPALLSPTATFPMPSNSIGLTSPTRSLRYKYINVNSNTSSSSSGGGGGGRSRESFTRKMATRPGFVENGIKTIPSTCDTTTATNCYKLSYENGPCITSPVTSISPSTTNWLSSPPSLLQYPYIGANCGIDSCLVEARHIHPSSTSYDIKFIDDIETESDLNPDLTSTSLTVSRSPSLLLYRNRSSIAQSNQLIGVSIASNSGLPVNQSQQQQNQPSNDYSHNNSSTNSNYINNANVPYNRDNIEFTNIRGDSGESTSSQRRYILSTCKKVNMEGESDEDELNAKPSCMSLDEEDHHHDGKSLTSTSLTFCKCTEDDDREINRENSNINYLDHHSDHRKTIISSPVHVRRKKVFLNFDSEELLNSLNDCNTLLTETYSRFARDESGNEGGRRTGHRGSLPQAVVPNESETFSKNWRSQLLNRSLPTSPMLGTRNRRKAQGKSIFYSPTMFRKVMKQKLNYFDCSSEEDGSSDDEFLSQDFRNLGSFQKSNMRKKIKVKRRSSRIKPDELTNQRHSGGREFLLHNKAPLWNEVSQVYQLDFGGRVTQESAKNFQIEHQGKQVMQFGRIDDDAYTLDFQYPFSALQALAVALANVTQRLK